MSKAEVEADAMIRGMGADRFWKEHVKTRADVEVYYKVVHPEYSDAMVDGICTRLERLLDKYNEFGEGPLTDQER